MLPRLLRVSVPFTLFALAACAEAPATSPAAAYPDPPAPAFVPPPGPSARDLSPKPFKRCVEAIESPSDGGASDGGAFDSGNVPVADVDEVIASLRPKFRECYRRALHQDPTVQGCVIVQIRINASGAVESTREFRREGLTPALATCISEVVTAAFHDRRPGPSVLLVPVTFVQAPRSR